MTNEAFIDRLMNALPESKDIQRADKIVNTCRYDYQRSMKANLQLQKITDVSKMFRRAKAFINNGISINFEGCKIFSEMNNPVVNQAIANRLRQNRERSSQSRSGLLSISL